MEDDSIHSGKNGGREKAPNDASEVSIARLMRLAGPRANVPPDTQRRVHDAVQQEWRVAVARRRRLRWSVPAALAASVLLAVALYNPAPEVSAAPVATVVRVDQGATTSTVHLARGDDVYPGDRIATGDQGIALEVNNGFSLRLAAGTRATFDSMEELALEHGKVYADSGGGAGPPRSLSIRTSVGAATDIGTRFAVAFTGRDMSVAVRDGAVDVSADRQSYTAEQGDLLILQPDNKVLFERVSPYDSSWEWAAALAPAFEIENGTLLAFLGWAARETGKELVFENESTRLAAAATRLHGSVADFTPAEAIHAVLPTTSFGYRVEEQRIVVGGVAR